MNPLKQGSTSVSDHSATGVIQCVGFARHWLEANKGVTFSQVATAFDIWESINSYKRLVDGALLKVVNRINGSCYLPQLGDLIIYHREFYGTGHVAVVKNVNERAKTISVVEQNYKEQYQSPVQQRKIRFLTNNRGYWLQEQHILGWKHRK
jgi:CHAP domain